MESGGPHAKPKAEPYAEPKAEFHAEPKAEFHAEPYAKSRADRAANGTPAVIAACVTGEPGAGGGTCPAGQRSGSP